MPTRKLLTVLGLCSVLVLASCRQEAPVTGETEDGAMHISMEELRRLGRDFSCTFTQTNDGKTQDGTVYIEGSEKRMRGDFAIADDDGAMRNAHMINDGRTTFIWADGETQGMTMEVPEELPMTDTPVIQNDAAPVNEYKKLDFTCELWNVDVSFFDVPSDVTFMDMSVQLKQMQNMMKKMPPSDAVMPSTDNAPQCGVCDEASDEAAKSRCRAALGC